MKETTVRLRGDLAQQEGNNVLLGRYCGSRTLAANPSAATRTHIVAITGQTLKSATRILERYMAFTPALSKAAMKALENAAETEFANQMQTRQA